MTVSSQAIGGGIRSRIQGRFQRWLVRRVPPVREALLSQRNIFIFPSAAGLVFLFMLLTLLLTGINYENNLVLALTFLLGGMFVISVLHTFANLSGLVLSGAQAPSVFVGQRACFQLRIRDTQQRVHDDLRIVWDDAEPTIVRMQANAQLDLPLYISTHQRGPMRPGRLRIDTRYPTGLIRAWCRIALDTRCVVFPSPGPLTPLQRADGSGDDGLLTEQEGTDDFSGFRTYREGDPLRHVAWKTLARGQPLQLREYISQADRQQWLDWDHTATLGDTEHRLSVLCRWVLEFERDGSEYGLRMPAESIAPGRGDGHRDRCLTALALFGYSEPVA